jgi:hypothetical protein
MLVVVPIAELERVQGMLECFLVGEIVAGSGVRIEGI